MQDRMSNFATGVREAWSLAKPYFTSEERWIAWGLIFLVVALSLSVVGLNVVINFWNGDFFNAIQAYDEKTCLRLLYEPIIRVNGSPYPMIGFAELIIIYVPIFTYSTYFSQMLQIKWRQWVTTHYVGDWLSDHAYYNISLARNPGAIIDNPDQRIAEDLRDFTANTIALGLDFITNLVSLFSFIFLLYSFSGLIHLWGVPIRGYLVWVALLYSVVGTVLTQLIGRRLIPLSFLQQRLEANFRYRLIRVRDNTEAIALAQSETEEHEALNISFEDVKNNFWAIMRWTVPLNFFLSTFVNIAGIFPLVVILPRYFAKQIGFGLLTQIPNAFGQVQGAFSWFVTNYFGGTGPGASGLVTWRATVSRLYGFREAMNVARAAAASGPHRNAPGAALVLDKLTLTLPDGRKLLNGASLTLPPGEKITLTGPSGSGKSTLFRAIAGIWPFGEGNITPPSGSILFLPQKPYFPLGSLKRCLTYPNAEDSITDEAAVAALNALNLNNLVPSLHETENWGLILSGGEQQRLALARALISKPDWLFLDEATSALDPATATQTRTTLTQHLPTTTIVAISHHDAISPRHLQLENGGLVSS